MLKVTDKVAALIGDALEANRENESDVLRLSRTGQDLGLAVDEEREGDQVVRFEERSVLVIDTDLAQELDGLAIDAVGTSEGEWLTVVLPEQ